MSGASTPSQEQKGAPRLRPVTIDELSDVRYLHDLSIRRLAASHLSEVEVAAFVDFVRSQQYTDRLAEMANSRRLLAITVMDELAATAGWVPANDTGAVARLMAVFVSPLFTGLGLGRQVIAAAEQDARAAGFAAFTVRTPVGAVTFFSELGYDVASSGVWPLTNEISLPVAFMRKLDPPPPRAAS